MVVKCAMKKTINDKKKNTYALHVPSYLAFHISNVIDMHM